MLGALARLVASASRPAKFQAADFRGLFAWLLVTFPELAGDLGPRPPTRAVHRRPGRTGAHWFIPPSAIDPARQPRRNILPPPRVYRINAGRVAQVGCLGVPTSGLGPRFRGLVAWLLVTILERARDPDPRSPTPAVLRRPGRTGNSWFVPPSVIDPARPPRRNIVRH